MKKKKKTGSRTSASGASRTSGAGLIWGGNGGVLDGVEIDSDSPGDNIPYRLAVECVLTALDGLWFTSDDPLLEEEVNDHVQAMKRKIQESL